MVKVWQPGQSRETRDEKLYRLQTNAQRMALPYRAKVNMAQRRISEWADFCYDHGKQYAVSVGGLDSITLLALCRLDGRPHHFDLLREQNPKEWDFWMRRCCTDPETGEKYGWGRVLDYIGVGWENQPDTDCVGQIAIEGM